MERVNLKQLKEALNKLPDEKLEVFFIRHDMITENPDCEIKLIYVDDEENWDKHLKMYNMPGADVLQQFAKKIWDDAQKCVLCKFDDDAWEQYNDDTD